MQFDTVRDRQNSQTARLEGKQASVEVWLVVVLVGCFSPSDFAPHPQVAGLYQTPSKGQPCRPTMPNYSPPQEVTQQNLLDRGAFGLAPLGVFLEQGVCFGEQRGGAGIFHVVAPAGAA